MIKTLDQMVVWILCAIAGLAMSVRAETNLAIRLTQNPMFDAPILWSTEAAPSDAQSQALWDIVQGIHGKASEERIAALEAFIEEQPRSAWTPSLRSLLGKYYRESGRYSLALQHWEKAWEETKHIPSGNGKHIADYTFAHWTRLLGSLGRKEKLTQLFEETKDRNYSKGYLRTMVSGTKEGLGQMFSNPGRSFACGSFALYNAALALGIPQEKVAGLAKTSSPASGFTMEDLVRLCKEYDVPMVAVNLAPTNELVVPSVVHWTQNHYAAIISRNGNRYIVTDPTFGHETHMTEENIRAESSGYFLAPKTKLGTAGRPLTSAELTTVRGQGAGNTIPDEDDNDCGSEGAAADGPNSCCETDCCGMPVWRVSQPFATLWLNDEPLSYQPTRGPRFVLRLNYKQRDTMTPSFTFNPGDQWECSLLSFVDEQRAFPGYLPALYSLGGGRKLYGNPVAGEANQTLFTCLPGWTSRLIRQADVSNTTLYYTHVLREGITNYYRYTNDFGSPIVTRIFLSEQVDAAGNTNRFEYEKTNSIVRLKYVIDPDGLTNIIRYSTNLNQIALISEVQDPYGRIARLYYDSNDSLTSCVDVVGLTNSFIYDSAFNLTNLCTPYGNTGFKIGVSPQAGTNYLIRSVEITQPDGGTQMYAYIDSAPQLPDSFAGSVLPSNTMQRVVGLHGPPGEATRVDWRLMNMRNSFHWDPRQYSQVSQASRTNLYNLTTNELKIAHQKHWFHGSDSDPKNIRAVLSMERYPSPDGIVDGQTVWYSYYGWNDTGGAQANLARNSTFMPGIVAKILPDGTTNFVWTRRNMWGYPTNVVTTYSVGGTVFERTNVLIYSADGRDLLEEWTTNGSTGIRLIANDYNSDRQLITSTNAVGDVTTYTYNSATKLMTSRKTSGGLTTTNIYESTAPFRLLKTIDIEIARTNTFTYTNDLVHTHTDERGNTVTNTYDALQRLTKVEDSLGFMAYTYDKLDLVAVRDRLGFTNRFTYDIVRRKTSDIDPLNRTNRYNWCSCGSLESRIDALGQTTSYSYNNAGWRTNVTYADNSTALFEYDLLGRVQRQRDPAGNWTTNTYNNQGFVTVASGPAGQTFSMAYDYRDRATNSVDANGVTKVMTYDDENRMLTRTFPDGGVERFGYSARGLVAYTNQLTNVTFYAYDEAGRKVAETNANVELTQFGYDPSGNLTNLLDGRTTRTRWKHDAFGRVTNKIDHLGTHLFFYSYDANSRLTSRTSPAKGTTAYVYDAVGNLTNIDYPVSTDIRMAYDALNRVTNMVDAAGASAFGYTSFGALAFEDGPWQSDRISYGYTTQLRTGLTNHQANASPWLVSYTYDGANRLQTLTSPAGTFTYTFHGAGDLVRKLALPTGAYVTNGFDVVARLTNTSLKNSSHVILNSHGYELNVGNQRTRHTRTDGSLVDYAYDPLGQLTAALGKECGGTTNRWNEQFRYTYDAAGNVSNRVANVLTNVFNVNSLNELTSVVRTNDSLTVGGDFTGVATNVTVADNGNSPVGAILYADGAFARTNLTLLNGTNTFIAVAKDSAGRGDTNIVAPYLPTAVTFAYDINGNLTNSGTRVFEYDDENQLTCITEPSRWRSEFTYDGKMRRRIRKEYEWRNGAWLKTDEVRYVYDGNLVLQERSEFSVATISYTRGVDLSGSMQGAGGIGGLLAYSQLSTTTPQHGYYHADGNGNVTLLIDPSQGVVARYVYDPFGNTLSATGPIADMNLYRFSSKEFHAVSGTTYYLYRYYEPNTQRWLSRDPLSDEAFSSFRILAKSQAKQKRLRSQKVMPDYVFVGNAPIHSIDPLGLDSRNCWMYATGFPDGEPGLQGSRKGKFPERCFRPYTCDKLKRAAKADDVAWRKDGKCDEGWTKVAFYEGFFQSGNLPKPDDYHFIRQDSEGHWSHKRGEKNKPETVDAKGKELEDPETANLDYPDVKYKKCEGYLCVPPKKGAK